MLLQEIITRKCYLQLKLENVESYIKKIDSLNYTNKASFYDKAVNEKFSLLSKIRSHEMLIDNLSRNTKITVSKSELTVQEAKALLKTSEDKIDTFSDIIEYGDFNSLDFFGLVDKRDILFEEFILLSEAVKQANCTINWEKDDGLSKEEL